MDIKITDTKIIRIIEVGARELSLTQKNIEARETIGWLETDIFGPISKLEYYDKYSVYIGLEIIINKNKHIIRGIEKSNGNGYVLYTSILNKSAKYLLPLACSTDTGASNCLFNKCLINTFRFWDEFPEYSNGNFLFLVYRFYDNEIYKQMESKILYQPTFVRTIDPVNNITIFVMELSSRLHNDIQLISSGRYSNVSKVSQNKIRGFFHPAKNGKDYSKYYLQIKKVFAKDNNLKLDIEKMLGVKLSDYIRPDCIELESKMTKLDETIKIKMNGGN